MSKIKRLIEQLDLTEKSSFKKWFETLVTEKGLDLDSEIKGLEDPNFGVVMGLTIQSVIDFCDNMPKNIIDSIKTKLVQIDFKNGNIMDFITYLAKGMIKATK